METNLIFCKYFKNPSRICIVFVKVSVLGMIQLFYKYLHYLVFSTNKQYLETKTYHFLHDQKAKKKKIKTSEIVF